MLRVTQVAIETVSHPTTAKARASQVALETVSHPTKLKLRASQVAVEVIRRSVGNSSTTNQPLVIVVAC